MLNNFKIGSKLTIGFVLVILLLVAVGITGYYSLASLKSALDGVMNQLAVTQTMSDTTDNVYLARVASANHSGKQDISYSEKVSEYLKLANEDAKKVQSLMVSKENKESVDKVIASASQYDEKDNAYEKLQKELEAVFAERAKTADDCDAVIHKIIDFVEKT
ncbi:MAG: MCP four helix bundle domain-containing protein [Planctomycetaceae bacterium]|nr:MCP four helix bundle domain-containing protein [Planctomycetaceae bacterium]